MDAKWTANFVEFTENELRSFGNVGGYLYSSPFDAWNACVKDMEFMKKEYPNATQYVNSNHNRIELTDESLGVKFIWEIQKMTDFWESENG